MEAEIPQDGFDPQPHLARLDKGAVLVSRDLEDPNFEKTAVLLCQYGEDGAYGLVLNRPSHMPLREVFDFEGEVPVDRSRIRKLYVGGPVQNEVMQILQVGGEPAPGSVEVSEGITLGGYWEDPERILHEDDKTLRIFLGYSGWATGQLEQEIGAGAWEVLRLDLKGLLGGEDESWMRDVGALKNRSE